MISDLNLRLHGTSTAAGSIAIAASGTTYSDNAVDLRSGTNPSGGTTTTQNRDIGEGEDLYAVITWVTAPTGAANSVTTFNVIVGTAADGSGTNTIIGTVAVPYASMVNGAQFVVRINPILGSVGSRYLLMQIVQNGTAMTGSPTAYIDVVTDIADSKKFYGSGFSVT